MNLVSVNYNAKILSVERESETIYTFKLEKHPAFNFHSGQFVWISLEGYARSPMAIASGENDDHIMLSIRKWGDLTTALFQLKENDIVNIDGPHGSYFPTNEIQETEDLYLIAGGTGITPIRSLIRSLTNGTTTHLFYGAQESDQLLYLNEFKELNGTSKFTIDKPEENWEHEVGFVTDLLKSVEFSKGAKIFICGPQPMLQAASVFFKSVNLDFSNIFVSIEKFDDNGNVVGPVLKISDPQTGL
jgi:NAD(P)H-flavin reductase